jgi:hypothetical protein
MTPYPDWPVRSYWLLLLLLFVVVAIVVVVVVVIESRIIDSIFLTTCFPSFFFRPCNVAEKIYTTCSSRVCCLID